jgi:hypothetical protein
VVQIARIHGKRGRVYLDITGSGSAEPLPFFARWTINHSTDRADVSAMGDTNKTYVSGMADAVGTFNGFYDDETAQTYTAAIDGLARKFYLYPDILSNTKYFWGTILVDMNIDGGVDSAVTVSASWNAASTISKVS